MRVKPEGIRKADRDTEPDTLEGLRRSEERSGNYGAVLRLKDFPWDILRQRFCRSAPMASAFAGEEEFGTRKYTLSSESLPLFLSDLSEQISTAGKEASGTGNMKLALNGSLTIGTLDGANVEILEEVGEDNIFIFGLTVEQVDALRATGYNPYDYYYRNEELRNIVDWLGSDSFTPNEPGVLAPLRHSLLDGGDPFLVMADYKSYIAKQEEVDAAFRDKENWARMAIMNTARVGKFSSDRTIHEYSKGIWNLKQVKID